VRVAALYDIHGNLPALRAVLDEADREGVDAFVIGGDVADGPFPRETIERLVAIGPRARFVRGNTDRELVDAYDAGRTEADDAGERAVAVAAGQITASQRDFLAAFAPTAVLEVDGLGPTLFCHGSPRSDMEIITRVTSDDRLRPILRGVEQRLIVCGHVHQQFDRSLDGWRLVNAGSVGLPYEGRPGAYWARLGPDVELRRTDYDLDELRAQAPADAGELLRESLFEPADPAEVSEFFERRALGAT